MRGRDEKNFQVVHLSHFEDKYFTAYWPLPIICSFFTCRSLLATDWAFAQTPEWVYQYIHPSWSNEWPSAIVKDSSGNTYTTRVLSSDNTTGGHISGIIKLNTSGQEQKLLFQTAGIF